jgi:radical SAM protein with 4Fe4S-binding SPASM domain
MTYEGTVRKMTISDGRGELLGCIHDEEDHNNRDTAERLRDVLRSMEGCSGCRMCPSCNGCKSQRIV